MSGGNGVNCGWSYIQQKTKLTEKDLTEVKSSTVVILSNGDY
jgi:hypothetical protein